ncbi:hypothetical protein ACFQV2_04760 [Actinokineospora soli]|uniref:ABC transmembrane type-1 domain-containing protein n=1 Tax=Actinokineospora soli TaxID=1048753 RepID=A0ABW2THZ0_9PSEU
MRGAPRGYLAVLGAFGVATAAAVLVGAELLAAFLVDPTLAAAVAAGAALAARAGIGWARDVVAARTAARVADELRRGVLDGAPTDAGATATLLTRGLDALRPYLTGYLPRSRSPPRSRSRCSSGSPSSTRPRRSWSR